MPHKCSKCDKVFTRKYNRDKHFKNRHLKKTSFLKIQYICPFCQEKEIYKHFSKKETLVRHVDEEHLDSLKYKLKKSAFGGKISIFSRQIITLQSLENFISDKNNFEEIFDVILHQLSKYNVVKVALIVAADYRIPSLEQTSTAANLSEENEDDSNSLLAEERDSFSLRTKRQSFNVHESPTVARRKVKTLLKSLLDREQDLLMRGSGWQFESLHSCSIEISSHELI